MVRKWEEKHLVLGHHSHQIVYLHVCASAEEVIRLAMRTRKHQLSNHRIYYPVLNPLSLLVIARYTTRLLAHQHLSC